MKDFLAAFFLCMIGSYIFLSLPISNIWVYMAGFSIIAAGVFTAHLKQSETLEELEGRIQKLENEKQQKPEDLTGF